MPANLKCQSNNFSAVYQKTWKRLHRYPIIWCSLLNYTVHGTLPHSFRNLKYSFWNFVTSEFLCMYPYLNVSGWIIILAFLWYLIQGFKIKILLISSARLLNSFWKILHMQISIPLFLLWISNFYKIFCRFLHSENTRSDASALIIQSAVLFQLDVTIFSLDKSFLSVTKSFSFYIVSRKKNLIVISPSRNLVYTLSNQILHNQ